MIPQISRIMLGGGNGASLLVRRTVASSTTASASAASAAAALPKKPFVPDVYHARNFNQAWLSDPSTYPLIGVLLFAGCFIVGASANAFVTYKDVRISPQLKHQVIRDWGTAHTKSMVEVVAAKPNPEGLGVNHEQWVKAKKATSVAN